MDLSREFTQDEERILQRQLYRPGMNKPAAKAPTPAPVRTVAKPSFSPAKPKPAAKKDAGPPSVWKARLRRAGKWAAALLVLFGLGAASYYAFSPDPVEEVKREMAELREKGKDMTKEERRALANLVRQDLSALTPKQRNELGKERQIKSRERLDAFFKKPKEQQIAELKKQILDQEARRQRRAAQRNANKGQNGANNRAGGGGGRGGPGGGGGAGAGGRGGPGGGGFGGGGFGGGGFGGPGGGRGGGDSNTRQKNRLDSSTPEERAQRSLMRGMTQQLRQQMGLSSGRGGGGAPFGGRR